MMPARAIIRGASQQSDDHCQYGAEHNEDGDPALDRAAALAALGVRALELRLLIEDRIQHAAQVGPCLGTHFDDVGRSAK